MGMPGRDRSPIGHSIAQGESQVLRSHGSGARRINGEGIYAVFGGCPLAQVADESHLPLEICNFKTDVSVHDDRIQTVNGHGSTDWEVRRMTDISRPRSFLVSCCRSKSVANPLSWRDVETLGQTGYLGLCKRTIIKSHVGYLTMEKVVFSPANSYRLIHRKLIRFGSGLAR